MTAPVPAAFAAVLRAERERWNEKFADARRLRPDLDAAAFLDFLRGPAAAVVEAAAAASPERAAGAAHAAYDAALILVGEKLAGRGGRHAALDELWTRLLPAVGGLVAIDPVRVIGSLSNAVFHLATAPGARPVEWIDRLAAAAPALTSVADLLRAGQLAAWRAGLAHLRAGALAAGDGLAPALAAALVGGGRRDWSALRDRLARDRWWDPSAEDAPLPRVVGAVGGFRGFGGLFPIPPRVAAVDRQIVVSAGDAWLLSADAFGAGFHRIDPGALDRAEESGELQIDGDRVVHRGVRLPLPALGRITSAAAVDRTVAVTGALSHAIALVAVET